MTTRKVHRRHEWVNLTPEDGHFLFGYYDRCPWDPGNRRHLALRIPQQDHLPLPGETADVGLVHREERRFEKLAETRAWCHQLGAMTLWLKHVPGAFVFNDFEPSPHGFSPIARVFDPVRGEIERYETHLYALSPDGRWGAAIDFGRIPRRGYSYALSRLPADKPRPDLQEDGLFLVNMVTGEKRLLVSYGRFLDKHPFPYDLEGQYIWLNHAGFNCDSSRVMVLLRNESLRESGWRTQLFTVGVDGRELRCPVNHAVWSGGGGISHQIWGRTPSEILLDAGWFGRGHEHVVVREDRPDFRADRLSPGLGPMGHLAFSPDGKWIVADTYPDEQGMQRIGVAEVATGRMTELGRFEHRTEGVEGDIRCDLHPRWSCDGRFLTVDTIHEGPRKIYGLDVEGILLRRPA